MLPEQRGLNPVKSPSLPSSDMCPPHLGGSCPLTGLAPTTYSSFTAMAQAGCCMPADLGCDPPCWAPHVPVPVQSAQLLRGGDKQFYTTVI